MIRILGMPMLVLRSFIAWNFSTIGRMGGTPSPAARLLPFSLMPNPALYYPVLLLLSGCSGAVDCPLGATSVSVIVHFVDAHSNDLLAGPVRGEIRDGDYRDSLQVLHVDDRELPTWFAAGGGRAGRYQLNAERDGYLPYVKTNLVAEASGCGVNTVFVEARLTLE
jgi:hypothetical protein